MRSCKLCAAEVFRGRTGRASFGVGARWIFSDSDLLYFPGAAGLGQPAWWAGGQCRFLLDQVASLDPQIETGDTPAGQPVNSGFLAAAGPLDWTEALVRWHAFDLRLRGEPVLR